MRRESADLMKTLAAALALFFFLPIGAKGTTIQILDLTDTVSVVDAGSSGRLTGVSCAGETCSFSINYPTNATHVLGIISGLNILEPVSFVVSDLLQLTSPYAANPTSWTFISDTDDGTPLQEMDAGSVVEDGTLQTAVTLTYLNAAGGQVGTDTIMFQSDVDEGAVPEPSSGLIVLTGLAMLSIPFLRRRAASPRIFRAS